MNTAVERLPDASAAMIPSLREVDCTRLLIERTFAMENKNLDSQKPIIYFVFYLKKRYFTKLKP